MSQNRWRHMSFKSFLHIDDTTPVAQDRLDGGDSGPFSMSYAFDLTPLTVSIRKVGLINPPIVRENTHGGLDIVAGYRRIETLKSLGAPEVPCRILPATTSDLECVLLNLYDNLSIRTLNDVEKSMVLNRLRGFVRQEEVIERYMPLLNLRPRLSLLTYYSTLEEFEAPIKMGIARKSLSPQTVRALQAKDHDVRLTLVEWILKLNFNFNQQKYFIEYIGDICIRDNIDVPDIFKDAAIVKMAREQGVNPPQKAKYVLEYLRNRRFPRLSRAEKLFQSRVSQIKLPKGVSLRHPPHFEGTDYLLEIAFNDGGTLMKKINELVVSQDLAGMRDPDWNHETE